MRHILFKTTLVAGLVTSLASVAATDLDSCLSDNSDKKDKMTICLDQLHQSMADAKKQELQKQYNDSLAELNKRTEELAKKQGAAGGAAAPSSGTPASGTANTGPETPTNVPPTTPTNSENAPDITTTPSTTGNANTTTATPPTSEKADSTTSTPAEQKKGVDVRPVPREKPKGVQWY